MKVNNSAKLTNMVRILSTLLLAVLLSLANGAPHCEEGWAMYKDDLCIKAFTDLKTYDEAKQFCASQGNQASLVSVKEADLQQLLATYTDDYFDYIWLGGKYDPTSKHFEWEDGTQVTYTNWASSYPRNVTNGDACIELRPLETRSLTNIRAKWAHVTCRKRNLVMCQKGLSWTLQDAVEEILKNRKQLEDDQVTIQRMAEQRKEDQAALNRLTQQQEEHQVAFNRLSEQQEEDQELLQQLNEMREEDQAVIQLLSKQQEEDQAALQHLNETLAQKQQQMDEVKGLQATQQVAITKAHGELTIVQQQITSQNAQLVQNRHQIEALKEHVESQQGNITGAQSQLASIQQQVSTHTTQIAQKEQQLAANKIQLTSHQTAITRAQSELSTVQQQVTSHNTQLTQKQQQIDALKSQQTSQQTSLTTVRNDLATVTSRVVPVGSVYIEYYNQRSPRTMWPSYTWQDVTSTYAGLFFRAYGGSSAGWGSIQGECAPRTTQMSSTYRLTEGHYINPLTIPANGWSEYGKAGESNKVGSVVHEGLRFYTSGCEVRPRNQAIRIWKRTA